MTFPQVAALVVALFGCITDLTTRRVPNVLTFGAAAGAFGYFLAGEGLTGLGFSAAGWVVGLLMFLPLFALRGLGGGDVKLMAALGAWIGPGPAVWLALFAALAGGPLALLVAASKGYVGLAFSNLWSLLAFWRVVGVRSHPFMTLENPAAPRLPYAVPIAVGLMVTLWFRY
jgi:prepilin peptidase CpaA